MLKLKDLIENNLYSITVSLHKQVLYIHFKYDEENVYTKETYFVESRNKYGKGVLCDIESILEIRHPSDEEIIIWNSVSKNKFNGEFLYLN